MNIQEIKTLGALKEAGYISKKIKTELRDNLIQKLQSKSELFEGIIGYEDTVIPQLIHAILSEHNINLLGLRGQAKTRIARSLTYLLDEYIPIVEGSEINDDPLNPISFYAKQMLKENGDKTAISWVHRSERFSEKLATPDVTVADLIGDVDPIKAANLKLSYADERVIHFGMIPRANRCIFVINELPDLQARIQVSLFNILQEGDVQIRGFKIRLPLDVNFVFTANPEDYTNRGSIVTPLKDRIGSQIITHYPNSIELAKEITKQGSDITLVTYGSTWRLVTDAAKELEKVEISCEVIDVQSLLPFDIKHSIVESLKKTNKVVLIDEDVSAGATAYMMQKVLEEQKGYFYLDSEPKTISAKDHRPAYGEDGDYFSKPNTDDIFESVYAIMHDHNPTKYPAL